MFQSFTFSLATAAVRTLLLLLIFNWCLPAAAQAPAWQSARAVATPTLGVSHNSSEVSATAVDAAGNIFLAGEFRNTVVLGGTTLTSTNSGPGGSDAFVAKFSPVSNQFVWAQRIGGTVSGLAVNGTSVYMAGYFTNSTADFGTIILANSNANTGYANMFVAKLTDAGSTGSFVWAQRAGGTIGNGIAAALALVVSGTSVYVAGNYQLHGELRHNHTNQCGR